MPDTTIKCPTCEAEIPVSEALAAQIRSELEMSLRREADERVKQAVQEAEARSRSETELELKDLQARLTERERKLQEAQQQELELRKRARELEDRSRELDLELQRRLDEERRKIEEALRWSIDEEHKLKLKEKEKQIEDLRKALEDAKRKSEQGSQELQGEVLELNIESVLASRFPRDLIRPVPKGARGADIIQEVRNHTLEPCSSIIWESKNTKHWSPGWIEKLKDDQREAGASVAVLVSVALPDQVQEFGRIDGVWVANLRVWPALAIALREQLIQVAFAHAASQGKAEKMELLYRYLTGDQFRQRVQGIVEAFGGMQAQLSRERRAMEKLWREREKQIERVITHTVGMYGEMRGIVGATLPEIPALELDGGLLDDPS